ncbi:MAG TPA: hypothetical protein VFI25_08150 [Planctomycetota bacterium]|nr:hypothetical protein [Planctomycetota bacterium]
MAFESIRLGDGRLRACVEKVAAFLLGKIGAPWTRDGPLATIPPPGGEP